MSWMRQLGSTGIEISALGLGTVKLGRDQGVKYPSGFTIPDDRQACALLAQARDLGINLIDTAPAYGVSEERLGKLLAGQQQEWVICSKVGEEFSDGQSHFDFSPEHARFSIERSLARLGVETIDIVLIHSDGDDMRIIREFGTLDALAQMKREGLIRAFGMSTKTIEGGVAAAQQADAVMVTYNLAQQEESEVLAACAANKAGGLIKKALASGHLAAVDDPVQASMELVFGHPGTTAAIVGTITPAHLSANVAAARQALSYRAGSG